MTHTKNQRALTMRSIVLGSIGSAILTASSLYIALKMGALPWPIVFAALVSVLSLKVLGSSNLHEANVCHAAMSAGAMVAGGLAFTIPAIWMVNPNATVTIPEVLAVSILGTALGLIACRMFQPYFIIKKHLAYPIGISAADTLKAASNTKANTGKSLFAGMGFSAAWAMARDTFHLMPRVLFSSSIIPGAALGMMNSPMVASLGFIVGGIFAGVWFIGAIIGNFGILWGLPTFGFCDLKTAGDIRTSLGLGLMLGVGAGVVLVNLFDLVIKRNHNNTSDYTAEKNVASRALSFSKKYAGILLPLIVAGICFFMHLNVVLSCVVVAATWFCVWLSAWLTGTTGVNPMEIFGVIVLLLIQALSSNISHEILFLTAGLCAVACGICGDVMNDLKAGDLLDTNPSDQFAGMVIGGLVGAVVAALLMVALLNAYGPSAFGPESFFVSAQASVVATMAGGIPHTPTFIAGLIIGCILACMKLPVMTLGLGVYLPFFISATAASGALLRSLFDRWNKKNTQEHQEEEQSKSQAIASGVLGGESLVGVVSALVALVTMMHH